MTPHPAESPAEHAPPARGDHSDVRLRAVDQRTRYSSPRDRQRRPYGTTLSPGRLGKRARASAALGGVYKDAQASLGVLQAT